MLRIAFISAVLSFVFSFASAGDSCSPVDLRKRFPANRDQLGSGMCYAFVAAELISYKLGREVSPLDVAYIYKRSQNEEVHGFRDLAAGYVYESLDAVARGGLCCDEDFGTGRRWDKIKSYVENYDPTQIRPRTCHKRSKPVQKPTKRTAQSVDVGTTLEQICSPRVSAPGLSAAVVEGTPSKILGQVDKVLGQNVPVGIEVAGPGFDRPGHGLTVVGRYATKDACIYIIRNSWGKKCPKDVTGMDFTCDDAGNILMARGQLLDVINKAAYLK